MAEQLLPPKSNLPYPPGVFANTKAQSVYPDPRNSKSCFAEGISYATLLLDLSGQRHSWLQFLPGRTVLEGGGTFDVPSIAAAKGSPLAKLLFRF